MRRSPVGFFSSAWHVALLSTLLLLAASLVWESSPLFYVLSVIASVAFLVGFVWLVGRVRVHQPFRDPDRFKWNAGAALVLIVTGLFLPRAFYQWWRYENDSPMPDWAYDAGMGLASTFGMVLLMLAVWLALSALVRQRAEPTRIETAGALLLGIGAWLFVLGAIVYRTDYTSEDILHFTLPVGLATTGIGTILMVMSDLWRRLKDPPILPAS